MTRDQPERPRARTVLLLIDRLQGWSGTETHLHRLVGNIDPERFRCVVAAIQGFKLEHEFSSLGIETHLLDVRSVLHPMGIAALFRLGKLIRSTGADLVVTYHTAADLLGPWPAQMCGVPIISCRRDEGFTKKPLHIRAQRRLNRKLRGMISASSAVVKAVERAEGYPVRLQQVIWNGEDLDTFSPAPTDEFRRAIRSDLGIPDDMCVITSVGSLKEIKDPMCQVEAMARLKGRVSRALLMLVGEGGDMMLLKAAATPIRDRIRFMGQRRDVADILRASDIYVQTSRSEGFSNATLQAMATGLPVVVTAVGGNPEFVTPECGALFRPGDAGTLAAELEELVQSPRKRGEQGMAGRTRCEEHGSLQMMTEAYMDAFERAIRGDFPGPWSGEKVARP